MKVSLEISCPAWIFNNLREGIGILSFLTCIQTHTHKHTHTTLSNKYILYSHPVYPCNSYTLCKEIQRTKCSCNNKKQVENCLVFSFITHSATKFCVLAGCSKDSNLLQPGIGRRIILPNAERHFLPTGPVLSDKAWGFTNGA